MKKHSAIKADLFAEHHHKQTLDKLGDPLTEIESCIDCGALAAKVERIAPRPVSLQGGRPPYPTETMVRILILKRLYNLSDEQMEYQLLDRMSYKRFCGLAQATNDGMWGKTMPELLEALPEVAVINRTTINAWDDAAVRAAVEKTGRKQILIAGVSLEVCASFPAFSAKKAGYDVRVVVDASGTFNEIKHETGLLRLTGAGIPVTDYATAVVEMLLDNADPKAHEIYNHLDMPFATLAWQLQQNFTK